MPNSSVVSKIIMINVLVFLLWNIYGLTNLQFMMDHFLVSWSAVSQGRIWTLLTTVFSHNMLFHLFINMFVLYNFGIIVENYLGPRRFLKFYLLAAIAGSLAHCMVSTLLMHQPQSAALGASGAISGVVLYFALIYPNERVYIFGLIPIPAIWAAVIFTSIDALGLIDQTRGGGTPIGHGAHLGGALAGLIYYLSGHKFPRQIRRY